MKPACLARHTAPGVAGIAAPIALLILFAPAGALAASAVSLSVEPISATAPLYLGSAVPAINGASRTVAVADLRTAGGARLNPSALEYDWTVDGAALASASGKGKTSIIVANPLEYRSRAVSVAVSNADGSVSASASASFSVQAPIARMYAHDPLLGIRFERALSGTYAVGDTDASFFGAVFGLPTSAVLPAFTWFLNGSAGGTGPTITLHPAGSGAGSASLSFVASEGDAKAASTLSLSFGNTPSSNLFGL